MVNAYLVIVVVILTLLIIAANIYLIVYFQHPEDKNVAWFPKIVVLVGMTLAMWSILMLPLDVANSNTRGGGGFPMDELWLAVYIIIAVFVVVIIPFAIFFYEGEDIDEGENASSQLASAIKGTVATLFFFMALVVILWFTIGIAEVPVVLLTSPLRTVNYPTRPEYYSNGTLNFTYKDAEFALFINETLPLSCSNRTENTSYNVTRLESNTTANDDGTTNTTFFNVTTVEYNFTNITTCYYPIASENSTATEIRQNGQHLKYRVTFLLYIISMVVFLGWVLFIVFGGIGLVALPVDCIANFKNRPIRISLEQYTTRKRDIGERATKLIEIGNALKEKQRKGGGSSRRARRRARTNYNKFRQSVFCLEEDYERLQTCYKRQGGKVLLYYAMLLFGIIAAVLTVLWILQILLFMFTQPYPFHPFLNDFLRKLDDAWGLLGTSFYGLFAFYLLLCVIKGNFKFGFRFFFLFPIHPMRVNGTLMNAFLFNTLLILICAVSITQFTTTAFSEYTTLTAINSMFAVSVRNLMGIKYIFIGYIYALFIMIFLAGIYLAARPANKPATDQIDLS